MARTERGLVAMTAPSSVYDLRENAKNFTSRKTGDESDALSASSIGVRPASRAERWISVREFGCEPAIAAKESGRVGWTLIIWFARFSSGK